MQLDIAAIRAQAAALAGHLVRTPCLAAPALSEATGADVYVKYENQQFTGSFKVRGALARLLVLTPEERRRGVIAVSARNRVIEKEDIRRVIDAAKVTRSALQNAASIAALFLTTEAVVADKPEKAAAPAGDPTGGMGGMDF